MIPSFNRVRVETAALEHNYRLLRARLSEATRLMAMVKSDAYGHGLAAAAGAFERAGCRDFGVAEVGEGVSLREAGCRGEIYIFLGFDRSQSDYLFSHRLTPVVFSREDLVYLDEQAARRGQVLTVFLKFDCGMARLGFSPEEAESILELSRRLAFVRIAGLISHLPCADDRQSDNSRVVHQVFRRTADFFNALPDLQRSLCNSGGLLYVPESHGELVRAGIALYGYYPDGRAGRPAAGEESLQPAMSVVTRVLQINEVRAGTGISYGHTYHAERDTRLAILPIGYSDGYFRSLSNRAEVLVRGRRAPIRGRICMNLCMADVTDIADAAAGDEVVILGRQGNGMIDADDIGDWADTISYEILCALGSNNERAAQ